VPQRRADQRDVGTLRPILFSREHAPDDRLDPEHFREVGRHRRAIHAIRARLGGDVERSAVEGGDRFEGLLSLVPHGQVRIRDSGGLQIPARRGLVDVDEPLRLGEGQWFEKQAVDEREHGDVGGDAQRQHRDYDRAAELLMRQRAPRIAKIRAQHVRSPFCGRADAAALPPLAAPFGGVGGDEVARGAQPDHHHGSAPASPGVLQTLAEQRLHLGRVSVAEAPRCQAQEQTVAVHLTTVGLVNAVASPARAFKRDRAILTSAARRPVSAASAR
jgi:hypothetical protein